MDPEELAALQRAIQDCSDRCLYVSARWCGELYASKPRVAASSSFTSARQRNLSHIEEASSSIVLDQREEDTERLVVARAYFNCRQLDRAGSSLKSCTSFKAIFLRLYSRYLATKSKANCCENLSSKELATDSSTIYLDLLNEIGHTKDAYLLFLKGLLQHRLHYRAEATASLIEAVNLNPWIWSAWQMLQECLEDAEELAAIDHFLPQHPMSKLFTVRVMIDLHAASEVEMDSIDSLLETFPHSIYLLSQKALIAYHQKDWILAEQIYDYIHEEDPYRIDDMKIYSNILYVMEKRTKLYKLAHDLLKIDKDSPEVCCIVGNHYSLRGDHEKAIQYFQRAVRLDQTCLSAWTLMGHEYIEIKNTEAAIQAYRTAIDVNRKDYRAWFGLGQAYELLSMPRYAIHYYQRASALRPYDVRVWQALASCYSDLRRPHEAIECYKRAQIATGESQDTLMDLKIATLYDTLGDGLSAALHHRHVITAGQRDGKPVAEYAKSCLYLGRYYFTRGQAESPLETRRVKKPVKEDHKPEDRKCDLEFAKAYLELVAESNAEETGIASDLLREVKTKMRTQ